MPLLAAWALWVLPAPERRRLALRLATAAVLLTLLSLPFLDPLLARAFGEDDGAAESRLPLMDVALEMIRAHPLLGVGLSSYEAVMRRYDYTPSFISEAFPYPVHNLFLHVAAETGIPALLCLLGLAVIALYGGAKAWRRKEAENALPRALAVGLSIGLLAYLLTALKELSSFDSGQMRILFLLCGLLLATARASRSAMPATTPQTGEANDATC
jgi:O-antigen ligase